MTRISIGALVVIVLALASTACGGDGTAATTTASPGAATTVLAPQTTTPTTPGATSQPPSDESPQDWAEFETGFMAGCALNWGEEQCACMFEEFRARYEFADFFNWAYQAAPDDSRIVEVAELCGQ